MKVTEEKSRIRNPAYGSEEPDPYQNVTDPEHWLKDNSRYRKFSVPCQRFKKYIFSRCCSRFSSASLCAHHQQSHHRVKKHKCERCPMKFSKEYNLEKHMAVHSHPPTVQVRRPWRPSSECKSFWETSRHSEKLPDKRRSVLLWKRCRCFGQSSGSVSFWTSRFPDP